MTEEILCCIFNKQYPWAQEPRGGSQEWTTRTIIPNYELGEFVLPIASTLGYVDAEVLFTRVGTPPPGETVTFLLHVKLRDTVWSLWIASASRAAGTVKNDHIGTNN